MNGDFFAAQNDLIQKIDTLISNPQAVPHGHPLWKAERQILKYLPDNLVVCNQIGERITFTGDGGNLWNRLRNVSEELPLDEHRLIQTAKSFRDWIQNELPTFFKFEMPLQSFERVSSLSPVQSSSPIGESSGDAGKKRPAFQRDHLWLKWSTEGLTPAKIRNRWNDMSEQERKKCCARTHGKIEGDSKQTLDRIKKALSLALQERTTGEN